VLGGGGLGKKGVGWGFWGGGGGGEVVFRWWVMGCLVGFCWGLSEHRMKEREVFQVLKRDKESMYVHLRERHYLNGECDVL